MKLKLGDIVEKAASSVGVTPARADRFSRRFLNRPCGCKESKEYLNTLLRARVKLIGKTP